MLAGASKNVMLTGIVFTICSWTCVSKKMIISTRTWGIFTSKNPLKIVNYNRKINDARRIFVKRWKPSAIFYLKNMSALSTI